MSKNISENAVSRKTVWAVGLAGASYNLVDSRARAYCATGGGYLDSFTLIYPFSPVSPSLWKTARYRLKYCLKGPLSPKQPTNQSKDCMRLCTCMF